jgi:hypothetical protein
VKHRVGEPTPDPQPRSPRRTRRLGLLVAMTAALSGSVFVAQACLCGTPGPQDPSPGGGSELTANLFTVASGGSTSCVRSSTRITYAAAVSANAVCGPGGGSAAVFDIACTAATGGDVVGVKDGAYPVDEPSRRAVWMNNGDCSDGAGANTNPNGASIPSSWVSFQCGDGVGTSRSVELVASAPGVAGGSFDINAKLHAEFKGRCFYFSVINAGLGGSTLDTQYVRFDDVFYEGFNCSGCSDFAFLNSEHGPALFCAQDGGPAPEAEECSPTGPYWETRWKDRVDGNIDLVGKEIYLHGNSGGVGAANISFINDYHHDQQARNNAGNTVHTGCIQTEALTGLLIDRSKFERCAIFDILFNAGSTLTNSTIQNSMFGCNTDSLDNSGDTYDQFTTGSAKTIDNGGNMNNVLIRYNTFCNQVILGNFTYTSTRFIANLFLGTGTDCSRSGITYDYNAVVGGTCGTNSTNVSAGLVVDKGNTDNNCIPTSSSIACITPLLDQHLTGSTVTGVDNAVTPTSSDYALTYDYDNAARTSGSRDVGADER